MIRHQGYGGERLKKKYIDRGVIMNDGLDSLYHNSYENGGYAYGEVEYHYDPAYEESVRGAIDLIAEEDRQAVERQDPLASCNAMLVLGSGPSPKRGEIRIVSSTSPSTVGTKTRRMSPSRPTIGTLVPSRKRRPPSVSRSSSVGTRSDPARSGWR